jgi:SAM-dependent methyltransferase
MRLFRNFGDKLLIMRDDPLLIIYLLYAPVDRLVSLIIMLLNTIRFRKNEQIHGPIRLDHLPVGLQKAFQENFMLFRSFDVRKCQAANSDGKCFPEQVPEVCYPYMPYVNGDFSKIWPRKMVDEMVNLTRNEEDFSCKVYPHSVSQYYQVLRNRSIVGDRALVIGSISPWIESILLGKGAQEVHTLEYHQLTCDHPQITTHQNKNEPSFPASFDLACSFSSIEHSGLGRYGDQIDPDGDLKAMEEIYDLLRPGGIALIGVPIGESNLIDSNRCRIYGKEYLEGTLFGRFIIIDAIPFPFGSDSLDYTGHQWQNQPLFVLQKPD